MRDDKIRLQLAKQKFHTKTPMIISLAEKSNYTNAEIARLTGTTQANVHKTLKRYKIKLKRSSEFKENKHLILNGVQERLVDSLTKEKITEANLQSTVTSLKMLHEMERLETNQSTSNVSVRGGISEELMEAIDRIAKRVEDSI